MAQGNTAMRGKVKKPALLTFIQWFLFVLFFLVVFFPFSKDSTSEYGIELQKFRVEEDI